MRVSQKSSNPPVHFNPSLAFKRSAATPHLSQKSSLPPKAFETQKQASIPYAPPAAPPQKITFKWVKGELLGKGSYAEVYLALNATTGEVMAVKQVELSQITNDRSDSKQADIMRALKFESTTLKDLDHPNIVQYLGYEESPRYLSIFLEYVPGGTISSCLKSHGRFSDNVTKSFTSQILVGLEYLHSRGIIHRDLKADNILVEPTGICKISDFGISKKAEDIHIGRTFTNMRGTVFWMAPEVLDSNGEGYDFKVDIWSVGCIVLEMWTADRPWSGEQLIPVMMKLSMQKLAPPVPEGVLLPEAAYNFRRQCFQKDPRDRPSAAELQKHPYLIRPLGWRFQLSDIQGSQSHLYRSYTSNTHKSRKSFKSLRQLRTFIADSHQRDLSVSRGSDRTDELPTLKIQVTDNNIPINGPPIVFITPPSSPKKDIIVPSDKTSDQDENIYTSKRRGFRIANPDPDTKSDLSYVYNPPPLPDADVGYPYSALLMVPPSNNVVINMKQSHPNKNMSITPNRLSTRRSYIEDRRYSSQNSSNDADDDSAETGDNGTWKKAPLDIAASPSTIKSHFTESGASHQLSRFSFSRKGKSQNRISTIYHDEENLAWAPRPYFQEVYDHLETFFPDHDLDKMLIEVGNGATPSQGKANRNAWVKKSIRMVAEERLNSIDTGRRRRTKLWDSNVEELRT